MNDSLQIGLGTTAFSKAAVTVDIPSHPNQAILAAMFDMQNGLVGFTAPHPTHNSVRITGGEWPATNRASQLSWRQSLSLAQRMLTIDDFFGHEVVPAKARIIDAVTRTVPHAIGTGNFRVSAWVRGVSPFLQRLVGRAQSLVMPATWSKASIRSSPRNR